MNGYNFWLHGGANLVRKTSKITREILQMYGSANLDAECIAKKSKMLLEQYRKICWSAGSRAEDLYDRAIYCGDDLTASLRYLEDFAPEIQKQRFDEQVRSLYATNVLVGFVDEAMYHVRGFYHQGEMYHELLSKSYLVKPRYTAEELAEALQVERSVLYDRRKEGILLFGLALWGQVIPNRQQQS